MHIMIFMAYNVCMVTSLFGRALRITDPLCSEPLKENRRSPMDSPYKKPVIQSFGVFFVVAWTSYLTNSRVVGELSPCNVTVVIFLQGLSLKVVSLKIQGTGEPCTADKDVFSIQPHFYNTPCPVNGRNKCFRVCKSPPDVPFHLYYIDGQATISLHTDSTGTDQGFFRVEYSCFARADNTPAQEVVTGCGQTTLTAQNGVVESPASVTSESVDCTWYIQAPPGWVCLTVTGHQQPALWPTSLATLSILFYDIFFPLIKILFPTVQLIITQHYHSVTCSLVKILADIDGVVNGIYENSQERMPPWMKTLPNYAYILYLSICKVIIFD